MTNRILNVTASGVPNLTAREREILGWSGFGLTRRAIARRMLLSPHTVDFHLRNIMRKLNAANCTAAVAQALSRGLLVLEPESFAEPSSNPASPTLRSR